MTATVKYQHGQYSGEIEVPVYDNNEENETIIARAKKQLFRNIPGLSMCSESYKIVDREYE